VHALAANEKSSKKFKQKVKGKKDMNPKKDSFQKSVEETSNRKCGNSTKAKIRCGYCNRGFHLEHAWMKKKIDHMACIIQ